MINMPESVRQKVAQYGPATGQADHVNHTLKSQTPLLLRGYLERLDQLNTDGSLNIINAEFKEMIQLFSDHESELPPELKNKLRQIINDKLGTLTKNSLSTPAHQEPWLFLQGSRKSLVSLGVDIQPLTTLFLKLM